MQMERAEPMAFGRESGELNDQVDQIDKIETNEADPIWWARDMVALRRPLRLRGRWSPPRDGLYRVATGRKVHGGFLVRGRRVVRASPYVKRYIHVLAMRYAQWVKLV